MTPCLRLGTIRFAKRLALRITSLHESRLRGSAQTLKGRCSTFNSITLLPKIPPSTLKILGNTISHIFLKIERF